MSAEPAALVLTAADLERPTCLDLPGGTAVAFTRRSPGKRDPDVNEDALAVLPAGDERVLLAVADGVGGHAAGERASAAAVTALAAELEAGRAAEPPRGLREVVLDGFDRAHREIAALPGDPATTLIVAVLRGRGVRLHHAGDSQALITGQRGRVRHWTTPHSPVGYAVEAGLLDERDALVHEDRHVISNALGCADRHIQVGPPLTLADRDTLLLASDGLADNLSLDEIVQTVRKGPLLDAVSRLVDHATARMTAAPDGQPSKPDDLTIVAWRPTAGR